jgi:hypothetical protein
MELFIDFIFFITTSLFKCFDYQSLCYIYFSISIMSDEEMWLLSFGEEANSKCSTYWLQINQNQIEP